VGDEDLFIVGLEDAKRQKETPGSTHQRYDGEITDAHTYQVLKKTMKVLRIWIHCLHVSRVGGVGGVPGRAGVAFSLVDELGGSTVASMASLSGVSLQLDLLRNSSDVLCATGVSMADYCEQTEEPAGTVK
jgi:hypothetical protein